MNTWDLAEALYLASYNPRNVGGKWRLIQPLAERPEWEQQMWIRVARKVESLTGKAGKA